MLWKSGFERLAHISIYTLYDVNVKRMKLSTQGTYVIRHVNDK